MNALGDAPGAAGGQMAVIISETLLKERSALFHNIIVPGSCIDLHEQSEAWVLVSKKGADGFDPANVSAVTVRTQTIAK